MTQVTLNRGDTLTNEWGKHTAIRTTQLDGHDDPSDDDDFVTEWEWLERQREGYLTSLSNGTARLTSSVESLVTVGWLILLAMVVQVLFK